MSDPKAALQFCRAERERFVADLRELIAIPSVSTDAARRGDVKRAAEWLAARLRAMGARGVEVIPTAGHPVVLGDIPAARSGAPTVLVYGHYDVQPVDPVAEWKTPPFDATVQGENLYGRGATDMKGPTCAALFAIEALVASGGVPVNLRFLLEGEEEVGSPHLEPVVTAHSERLAADVCLNPDAGMLGVDSPTITCGLRGLAYFELRVRGPKVDLHSGQFGGAVHNPAIVLAELIAGMHDAKGRITLPGFYDRVRPLGAEERAELARLPSGDADILAQSGAPALFGEEGYSAVERVGARPTLDVNGMLSGFTGEGSKTVLPATAMAKISTRLVPDQDPKEVKAQLEEYLKKKAPPTVAWELKDLAGTDAAITRRDSPAVAAMSRAMEAVWGKRPLFERAGGSIAVVAMLQKKLAMESLLMGCSLPDDAMHSPNEKLHLPTWHKCTEAFVRFFCYLA